MSIGEIDESMAAANAATATSKKYGILPKASTAPVPVASKSVHANRDIGKKTTTTSMTNHRPFYRSGGMMINLIGIVINLIAPLVILCRVPNDPMKTHEQSMYFIRVMLIAWLVALITTTRSKTTYCIFVVPTYIVSFIVLPMILQQQQQHQEEEPLLSSHATASYTWYNVARILCWTAVVASWKINICMSVCMHRYASHAAFKCGRYMNIGLCILGCAANQGGPLWWASQHRCHHKLRFMETDIYVHVYPYLLFCLHASMCRSLQYLTDQFFLCFHFCRFHPSHRYIDFVNYPVIHIHPNKLVPNVLLASSWNDSMWKKNLYRNIYNSPVYVYWIHGHSSLFPSNCGSPIPSWVGTLLYTSHLPVDG